MDRRKSRLEAVSASDPALDNLAPRRGPLRRLPIKLQVGLALALLALLYGLSASLRGDLPLALGLQAGGAVAIGALAIMAGVMALDAASTRRRRASKRPPASFK